MTENRATSPPTVSRDRPGHELRLTERCRVDDLLEESSAVQIDELATRHSGVAKFLTLRGQRPIGTEVIQSVRAPSVYSLHVGRYRGATWYDQEYKVVWLLAYGIHRSGDSSDTYKMIEQLDHQDRLLPTAEDYEALFRERAQRHVPEAIAQMSRLLAEARQRIEQKSIRIAKSTAVSSEHTALLRGDAIRVTIYVRHRPPTAEESEQQADIEEIWLAVSVRNLEEGWLTIIRAALLPQYRAETWTYTKDFPERGPSSTELRFFHWHYLPVEKT